MESDLGLRRKQSLNKVKKAWSSIIEKYSSLSENQQGDVIDILTGEIVTDTGHLRSLKQIKDDVWVDLNKIDNDNTKTTDMENLDKSGHSKPSNKNNKNINISKVNPQTVYSQPGDTSYIVTSSQHMTRSKVIGDDNILLNLPSNHKNSNESSDADIVCTRQSRSGLIDKKHDPLNMLDSDTQLETPSKVRRLRKALDQAYTRNRHTRRSHIHKLVLRNKRKRH